MVSMKGIITTAEHFNGLRPANIVKGAKKAGKALTQETATAAKEAKKGATVTGYSTPTQVLEPVSPQFYEEIRQCGIDGAYEPSVYDTLRARMYPQLFENYNVGAGIVKGKMTRMFDSLKHLNERFSKPGKEIRLAPLGENSVRGRNIVTLPIKAVDEVKEKGIERIVDLRAEVNSTVNGRLKIKNGKKYINGMEYVHVPVSYNNGTEDLTTIQRLPEFFEAMDKGHVYIGCNMGSHRTDFAIALNYALNTATKEASPILYLPVQEATKGVQRIFNKINKMSPEDLKALGLSEEFMQKLPKDKEVLNQRLVEILSATKEAK